MGIIITETEKKRILSLLKESINTAELISYANEYIDGHSCDQIYKDLLIYQTAVNNNEVSISSSDKVTLEDSLEKIKKYKGMFCGMIKSTMKDEFKKQADSDPESLLESMCWFSKNVYFKQLKACQKSKLNNAPDVTKTEPKINTPSFVNTKENPLEKDEVKIGRIDTISKTMTNLDDLKKYITSNVNSELKIKNNPPYKVTCENITISYDNKTKKYTMNVNLEVCNEEQRSWFFTIIGSVGGTINKSFAIDFKNRFKSEGSSEVIECEKTINTENNQWSELILIGNKPKNAKLLENRNIY